MNHLISVTKSDGTKQLFEEEKLVESLRRVGTSEEVIDLVVEEVEKGMKDGMTTSEIYSQAFTLLRKHSYSTAVKYSIRRAMLELGPEGFPFEKYVARIFKMRGYEAVTDQTLLGKCVEHEVDVVAWKDDELAMVEAKYHNEFNLKSDLKVVLYVKARFDDLSSNEFDYGGKKRKLTDRYLFTNTKFTDKAIKYGECSGLKLIGWNYPKNGNLHDIIEDNKLHPISCITSLSRDQKKELVNLGILACVDIQEKPTILGSVGMKDEDIGRVLAEIKTILE